jgi:hypothetical protein
MAFISDRFENFAMSFFPEKMHFFGRCVWFPRLFERFFVVNRSSGQLGWETLVLHGVQTSRTFF